MKIKRVECDQFAGLHDIDVEFADGLNLVIGENESGKSTLADLIFRILFKDTKIDGRSDANFIDCYFPQKVNGPQGDFINGTLIFDTKSGTYKLTREWEKGKGKGNSILTTPERTGVKNTVAIARILSDELEYREGVFDEIIFASQKRKQSAIESILKALPKKKNELTVTRDNLTSTLTQAVLETGGVSLERIEQRLQELLKSYESHWDYDADTPERGKQRGINNKWKQEVGKILNAYYAMEETRQAQKDAEDAEKKVERCQKDLREREKKKNELKKKLDEFQEYRELLRTAALLRNEINRDKDDIKKMEAALIEWPQAERNLEKALELQKQQKFATVKRRYSDVKKVRDDYKDKEREISALTEITREDVKTIAEWEKRKALAESTISGLNLTARIKQLGDIPIGVRNIATGDSVPSSDGKYNISGAVEIIIPDIMEMQLMPGDIDVDQIQKEIRRAEDEIKKGFELYCVSSLEELQEKQDEYEKKYRDYKKAGEKLTYILNGESWETIKEEYDNIDIELLSEEALKNNIIELCRTKSIDAFLGGVESTLENYKNTYGTKERLSEGIAETERRKSDNEKKLEKLDHIPEKYQQIEDPEKYENDIRNKIGTYEEDIKEWNNKCMEAIRGLGDRTAEDFAEELLEKESAFKTRKAEYAHWKNISDVFFCMKEQLRGNPMEDIEAKFREYLSIISNGNIELQSIDEKMSANISSGNNKLAYDILSNGTKDTISLAFRLAMLEHLYPEGEGLAVFDDAFTEMDPRRVQQSCRLIEKFAEKNQVIFITCDDKYSNLLKSDKIINMCK